MIFSKSEISMHWQLLIAISRAIISVLIEPIPLRLLAACSFAELAAWLCCISPWFTFPEAKLLIRFWFSLSTLLSMDSMIIVLEA
jgi:hypothetical protein